jgi:hypothetical protein
MGRPLPKKFFGRLDTEAKSAVNPTVDGGDQTGRTITNTSLYSEKLRGYNIPVEQARIPGGDLDIGGDAATSPYIIAQKGTSKYRVNTSSGQGNCILVDDDGSSQVGNGEMVIKGFLSGDTGDGTGIAIKKLTKFYATDFNGNRYKWYVDNTTGPDSALANVLVLVTAADTSIN